MDHTYTLKRTLSEIITDTQRLCSYGCTHIEYLINEDRYVFTFITKRFYAKVVPFSEDNFPKHLLTY